jgi:hypothetical protein
MLCRDPIAVNFLSQGWIDQTHLWKTRSALRSAIFDCEPVFIKYLQ